MIKQLQTAILAALIMSILTGTLHAQAFDYQQVEIEIKADKSEYNSGESGELIITLEVPVGFSITDIEGVFDIVPLGDYPGITFGELEKPEPDKIDVAGGHFIGETEFRLPFTVADEAKTGEIEVTLGFLLQACDEETGMCFFPTDPEDYQRTVQIEVIYYDRKNHQLKIPPNDEWTYDNRYSGTST